MTSRAPWRETAGSLHADLVRVFGDRLKSLLVYDAHGTFHLLSSAEEGEGSGPASDRRAAPAAHPRERPIHTMGVVENLRMDDLSSCAVLAAGWARRGLATPLLVQPAELARSLDAFPLEFSQIMAHHVLVAGTDPFEQLSVRAEDLRRACEGQVRSHLLHLREGFIEAGGRPSAVAELVAASSAPFHALLESVARLGGSDARTPEALASYAEISLGLPGALARAVLQIAGPDDVDPADAVRLYGECLDATERLAKVVDEWPR